MAKVPAAVIVACLFFCGAAAQDASRNDGDVIARILAENAKPAAPSREPVVMDARIGEHADRTRFVVELSDPVNLRTFTLNNPDRVVIDMPAVSWHLQGPPRPSARSAVRSYRYGLFRPGNSRFVIDLNQPVRTSDILVLPPEGGHGYRVVIDLFPIARTEFDRTAGWPVDLKARENAAEIASLPPTGTPRLRTSKKTVVIDAGHGGIDPGTQGVDGTLEKDIVLAEAKRLHQALEARGYEVHMTRDSDVYIPLRQRVRIARSWHADLFISIHADSNHDPSVTGLSVYTLSEEGSDKEAAALAKKENDADKLAGVDLSGDNSAVAPILIDLAQRDTMNKSSHFAENAIAELAHKTDILPRQPHRSGALVVLKAPDVPAVLVELGYLSNQHDARQMKSAAWQVRVANALAAAVDRQFMTAAAVEPAARGVQ